MLIEPTKNKILVIGDVMIDIYILGNSNRLSPEAPVPIVLADKEKMRLGGAANVANNITSLGGKCSLLGCKGRDRYASILHKLLLEKGIEDLTFEVGLPTITKTRIFAQNQQIVRIDREEQFTKPMLVIDECKKYLANYENGIIIVSDYGKGLCSKSFLIFLIETCRRLNIRVFIDPKGADWSKYENATLIKPNLKELSDIIGIPISNTDDVIIAHGQSVMKKLNINYLLVTRSEKGMTLLYEDEFIHFRSRAKKIFDVSGAGDTVIASLVIGLLEGQTIKEATCAANIAAGLVVSKFGTATINKQELKANF